jgi:hypothetical protein
MSQDHSLEILIIKKFIENSIQDRYIQFVTSIKNRHKFIRDLPHFRHFKWELLERVDGNIELEIFTALQKSKIENKNCYVISENSEIDKKTLDIKEAIQKIVGYGMGTILVFGEADMIYYESETIKERYISKKII